MGADKTETTPSLLDPPETDAVWDEPQQDDTAEAETVETPAKPDAAPAKPEKDDVHTEARDDEKATAADKTEAAQTGDELLPPDLNARAVSLGLTDADFEGVETVQEAERMIRLYEKRLAAPAAPITPEVVKPDAAKPEAEAFPELSEDEHDPQVIKAFKMLKADLDAAKERLAAADQMARHHQQQALWTEVQGWVGAQSDDWKGILGDGRKSTPETQANLKKVLEHADILAAGYERSGRAVPGTDVLLAQARDAVFGSKAAELSARKLSMKLKTRQGGVLRRPTARRGSDQLPRSEVTKVVQRLKAEGKIGDAAQETFE